MIGGLLEHVGADLSAAAGVGEAAEWALAELHQVAAKRECRVELVVLNALCRSPFMYRAVVTHERAGVIAALAAPAGGLPGVIDQLLQGFRA